MNEIKEIIKQNHLKGSKGIFNILAGHGTFKRWTVWVSLALSVIPGIAILCTDSHKSFALLSSACELIMSVFPSLLGFSLAGYALIVGYSNLDLIKAGSTPEKHSAYQILSAIFALGILMQVVTTILDFILTFLVRADISKTFGLPPSVAGDYLNVFLLSLLLFLSIYSLFATTYIINNLFTMGQANSLFLTARKMQDDAMKGKETNADKQVRILEEILKKVTEINKEKQEH